LRTGLEETISERTNSLQAVLIVIEQREAALRQSFEELQASQAAMRDLSLPIIPILPGVLVAPLIGAIDTARARLMMDQLLRQVEVGNIRTVILDVTGMPIVDTQIAKMLMAAHEAIRLLGAQTLIVGIRPEVAHTIVSLGISLEMIDTYPDLQAAVLTLITQQRNT
jgi:rsbT co-antagonist protein RsbR